MLGLLKSSKKRKMFATRNSMIWLQGGKEKGTALIYCLVNLMRLCSSAFLMFNKDLYSFR